jgi:hypothetical protein
VPMTKIAKCTCGNAHSAPSHNLYGTHENSIPFLHRDLAGADFTSLSLLNRETCQMFGLRLYVASIFAISAPTSTNLSTLRLAELGDALDKHFIGASPALRLLHPGCVFYRFVV